MNSKASLTVAMIPWAHHVFLVDIFAFLVGRVVSHDAWLAFFVEII
jgi:hypothetical protein